MTARNYSYRTNPPPFPNWKRRGFYLQNMKKAGAKRTLLRRGAGGGTRTRTPSLVMDFESTSSTNSNTPAFFQFGLYYTRCRSKMQEKFVGISSIRKVEGSGGGAQNSLWGPTPWAGHLAESSDSSDFQAEPPPSANSSWQSNGSASTCRGSHTAASTQPRFR